MLTSTIIRYRSHLLFAALATCLSCGDGDKHPAAAPAETGAQGGTQAGQPATPAVGPSSLPVLPTTSSAATPPVTKPTTPPPLGDGGAGGASGDKPPVGKLGGGESKAPKADDLAAQGHSMMTRLKAKKEAAKKACTELKFDSALKGTENKDKACKKVHLTFCEVNADGTGCKWTGGE